MIQNQLIFGLIANGLLLTAQILCATMLWPSCGGEKRRKDAAKKRLMKQSDACERLYDMYLEEKQRCADLEAELEYTKRVCEVQKENMKNRLVAISTAAEKVKEG
ncbi:MAG: hypothetical protein Q4C04_04305 [Clostridia bacterium]|nr:hypothetical protein [Clostridia bacterium]